MPSILFICVHNACRSRMAEVICRRVAPVSWTIASVGSHPSLRVDPKAVAILTQHGLDMGSSRPKGFHEILTTQWDYAVSMGCSDRCPDVPARTFIEWGIPDPLDGPMERYQVLYNDLQRRIGDLIVKIQNDTVSLQG